MEIPFTKLERSAMKKMAIGLFSVLCIGVVGVASAENKKPSGELNRMTMVTAEVIAIDLPTRTVTLKGPKGNEFEVRADQRVKRLSEVHVGDKVDVSYYESLMWSAKKAGDGSPGATVVEETARARPGSKPAGEAARQVKATVTIEAIDLGNGTVTLKGPQGNSRTIKARDPKNLEKVQVGDLVDITYTEALAVQVRPARKNQ
jgi:Cu/Ag efflux protein CusF